MSYAPSCTSRWHDRTRVGSERGEGRSVAVLAGMMALPDRLTLLALLGVMAALLIVAAFAVPLACCDDRLMGLPEVRVRQIKTQARHSSDLPPLKQQLIVHEASESLESTRASVVWRTAFGIEAARGEFNGRGVGMRLEFWDYFRPWALLGLAVFVLLVPAGLLIRREYAIQTR